MAATPELHLSELIAQVRRIEVQSRRLVSGMMAGAYSSIFRGAGIEFDEVREYAEGDDPRTVDWQVTARVGRPFVKTYVDERELTVLFLLDLSASMSGGFGPWSVRQMAARLCACLALSAVSNNDRVGLIAFGERIERCVPPRRGQGHALRIVRDCLALPCAGTADPGVALDFAARTTRRHAIVFLLSDFLWPQFPAALTRCARQHDLIAVRLLPPELAAPAAGLMHLADPERGVRRVVDWRSATVREAYAGNVARWRQHCEQQLRRARVDVMDVPVPATIDRDAVVRPLLRFFAMRARRGEKR